MKRRKSTFAVVGAFLAVGIGLFVYLRFEQAESIKDALQATGIVLSAGGLLFAFYSMRENHRLNRYQFTLRMMEDWNERVRYNLDLIRSRFPEIMNVPEDRDDWKMPEEDATRLGNYRSDDSSETMELRSALISTLNFFEGMTRAYELRVVERSTVAQSFAPIILDVWIYCHPFVKEIRRDQDRDPWPPLGRVTNYWIRDDLRQRAIDQASEAEEDYQNAISEMETKPKSQR